MFTPESNMNSGAYIFKGSQSPRTTEHISLFIYIKLSPKELSNALPISYDQNNKNSDYLVFVIENGIDYLGQSSKIDIDESIKNNDMINLLNNNYNQLTTFFPNLSRELYQHYIELSKKNLKIKEVDGYYIDSSQKPSNEPHWFCLMFIPCY